MAHPTIDRPVPEPDQAPRPSPADQDRPRPAPDFPAPVQVRLPIRANGKRGSERIRFRIWQDPRLTGLVQTVALVISEFVDQAHAARLKGQTIADCAHKSIERCLKAANEAAELGVFAIDRRSHHRRYVFLDSWLRWYGGPTETTPNASRDTTKRPVTGHERHDETSCHDTTKRRVTGEPVQENQISKPIAAADPSRATAADRRRQEQQQRREDRIEGLFAAIAPRAREAGHLYDEADERRRLARGEITVEDLQRQADQLLEEVREHRLRRAHRL